MTSTNDNGIQTLAGAARRHPCSGRSIEAWICNSLSDAMRMFCVAHCDVLRTDCTKVSYFQGHLLQLHHNPATHGGLPRARTRKHAHFRMVSCCRGACGRDSPPQPSPAPSACSSSPASCICCHCCSLSLSLIAKAARMGCSMRRLSVAAARARPTVGATDWRLSAGLLDTNFRVALVIRGAFRGFIFHSSSQIFYRQTSKKKLRLCGINE